MHAFYLLTVSKGSKYLIYHCAILEKQHVILLCADERWSLETLMKY